MTWRVGYELDDKELVLTLGADPKARPAPASLKGFVLRDAGIVATDASEALPLKIKCARLPGGRIRIGSKEYEPAVQPSASSGTPKKEAGK